MRYYTNWAVIYIDQQIAEYYRALLPKAWYIQPQRYPAHITIVRAKMESPNKKFWGRYEGEQVEYEYESGIKNDGLYFWLSAWSPRITEIRQELGLPAQRDRFKVYHITVGNTK